MPSGQLGAANLSATTNTTLYTVPSAKVASFSVNICNRNASAVAVRIAIAATATPALTEWVEYDASIPANGVLERTGFVAEATKNLVVYSSAANVTAMAYGYED